ncbi:hypothetical protein DGo_PB0412 (plasmid) [Deinococcus gobiensis I-0]|uniref:Uncharacterized protein n=1 Tax=Deinococcus gobiensis (strain DSM 21396 / JCM 16679 / CGMCC 1.7299 / I-0) TaxID=745776 RepID=H8H2D4_DEIGI|nr:hypothetical protein DGo_PB0412 [Deinococcus gobiensis I-0]
MVLTQTPEHADEHQSDANETEGLRPAWFGHRAIVTRHAPAVSESVLPELSSDTPERSGSDTFEGLEGAQ